MKTLSELLATPRLHILRAGEDGGWAEAHLASSKKNHPAKVVFSTGGGWDHVSVSFKSRCPTWEEMCELKRLFFYPEEVCVQYHTSEREYVNNYPYCLHLWRYQKPGMPMPPASKNGQTLAEAMNEGIAALENERNE